MEEKIIYKNQKRVSDKDLILSYKLTGNVWKTGEKVGLCGQSVHQRLTKLGVINKMNYFTEKDTEYLMQHYVSYRNSEDWKSLAIILNRTVSFINRKAKELGLDAIHDTIHEMCKDEARHGKAFLGLLERYFGEYKK